MLPESSKFLLDIRQALDDIGDFTRGFDVEAYLRDAKCRAAVERKAAEARSGGSPVKGKK